MAIDKTNKLKNIKALVNLQLEYLAGLEREYIANGEKDYHSPNNAGFFRISIELNRQIQKLKNNN